MWMQDVIGLVNGGIYQKAIERVGLGNVDASSVSAMSEDQCNKEARRQQSHSFMVLILPALTACIAILLV
jgi:hypothetical protein